MKLIHLAACVAFFTASMDVILAFQLGGTIRAAQLMMLFVVIGAATQLIQTGTVLWSSACSGLALWVFFQALLIGRSSVPDISVQLYVLLLFTVAGVFAVLQLYGRSDRLEALMKAYLYSFVFVACFGLFQFVTPGLHLGYWFVVQWIIHGVFPRINGFSYEPSYFITYLLVGWIMLVDLRVTGARIVEGPRWKQAVILVGVILFLSTSKLSWIFMIVEGLLRLGPMIFHKVMRQLGRFSVGSLWVRIPKFRSVVFLLMASILFGLLLGQISKYVTLTIFVAGSGLANTTSQSLGDRLNGAQGTWMVIQEHPWLGLSIGGVSGRVAEFAGVHIQTMADLRAHWAQSVPLEMYASGGLLGSLPIFWFFYNLTLGQRHRIRTHWGDDRAKWMHAMIRAMVFQWICLFANGNLLRVYVWFHLTMMVVVAYQLTYRLDIALPSEAAELAREEEAVAALG